MPPRTKQLPRIDLNPSAADRWTTCTASPGFIMDNWDKLPPSGSAFSEEGTTAHEVAAAFLQDREPRAKECPTEVDPEMRWHGWNYAEYVKDLMEPGARLLVEQKLPLWYMEGRNAIVDAVVINITNLHIVDLKYGAGVIVSPENSKQATIYAACVINTLGVSLDDTFPISIHIYQPRGRASEDAPFHIWATTWAEVGNLAQQISDAAQRITVDGLFPDNGLIFAPSEKACQWCPAKGFCEARKEELTSGIEALSTIDAAPVVLPLANTLSHEQRAAIEQHGDKIAKWISDVQEYNLAMAKQGEKLPGFKLVLSRGGNRYWSDPKAATKLLLADTMLREDEVLEKKLIGPAAVEKLLGKGKMTVALTNLIAKPPGNLVLAPEGDKREVYSINAGSEFEPI